MSHLAEGGSSSSFDEAAEESYFAEFRRGEVDELRVALQTAGLARDECRAREAMARTVGYMGLGADVSPLFLEVVRAAGQAIDPTLKRLCHLYLCRYARARPDLALLAVNTLARDCAHTSPAVRGLSLRALAGLRLRALAVHLAPPALSAAQDPAPYVRRAASLSLAKLARVHPALLARLMSPRVVRLLLRDRDPQTALNALVALAALRLQIVALLDRSHSSASASSYSYSYSAEDDGDNHLSAADLAELVDDLGPDFAEAFASTTTTTTTTTSASAASSPLRLSTSLRPLRDLHRQQDRLGAYGVDVLGPALSVTLRDRLLAVPLLNRLPELNEWSQCLLLEHLAEYIQHQHHQQQELYSSNHSEIDKSSAPSSSASSSNNANAELLSLLNALDSRLCSANLGVLLATARLFLLAADLLPPLLPRVCARLAPPLLSHLEGGTHEQAYVALAHLAHLARLQPLLFAERHRHFYCRHNEPAHLRLRKLALLPLLAVAPNAHQILAELAECAYDPLPALQHRALLSMGHLARRLPDLAVPVTDHLLSFLRLRHTPLIASALLVATPLVRRYPPIARALLPELAATLPALLAVVEEQHRCASTNTSANTSASTSTSSVFISSSSSSSSSSSNKAGFSAVENHPAGAVGSTGSPAARSASASVAKALASAVWLLGQHGHNLRDGPYLLEALVRRYAVLPAAVRLQLLCAVCKQLFCRPAEVRPVLAALLRSALADTLHAHVHDRALFYYRLLAADLRKARAVITATHVEQGAQALLPLHQQHYPEEPSAELTEQIGDEFNTLTVLYEQPTADLLLASRPLSAAEQAVLDEEEDEDDDYFYDYEDEETPVAVTAPSGSVRAAAGGVKMHPTSPAVAPAAPTSTQLSSVSSHSTTRLNLSSQPQITPVLFQEQWTQLEESGSMAVRFTSTPVANLIESKLRERGIITIASGVVESTMKFFFFAEEMDCTTYLAEMTISITQKTLGATFKSSNSQRTPLFVDYFKKSL